MTRFKVGDKVKLTKEAFLNKDIIGNPIVTKNTGIVTHISRGLHSTMRVDDIPVYINAFELDVPTGFEVGKKYLHIKLDVVYEILFLGKNVAFSTRSDGVETLIPLDSYNKYEEYIPPPPEEWRIVYKDRFGNVTVGKVPFKSESEALASRWWTDHKSSAFKTIRVDA